MRGIGDELPPGVLELRQPQPHPLECRGELGELVPARVDDRLAEIAARDPVGGALQPADPAREDRRRRIADEEGGGESDQTRDDEPAANEMDAPEGVMQRGAQQDDGTVDERIGRLRIPDAVRRDRAPCATSLSEGTQRKGIVLDIRRRHGTGVAVDEQLRRVVGEWPEVDDPGV